MLYIDKECLLTAKEMAQAKQTIRRLMGNIGCLTLEERIARQVQWVRSESRRKEQSAPARVCTFW